MGLFDRWRKSQQPGQVMAMPAMPTAAGVYISEDQALRLATVQSCVRVLSEDVAALPLHIYERTEDGGKKRATDHPLYEILHDRPNSEMTSMDFRQALMVNVLLSGNAYAFIEYDRAGRVLALWPLVSSEVEKLRGEDGEIIYRVGSKEYTSAEILAVHGMSYDGQVGLSPIAYARATMGLASAAETFGSMFFGKGTNLGGMITMPGKLSDDSYKRLKEQLRDQFSGLKGSHGVPVLEEGATYSKIGVNPNDAQFLDTRKFQRSEIAAIYRIPPHMIGDLERATFSNIEHQSIEYLQRTLTPWLVRIEQAMRNALLTRDERKRYIIEHDTGNFLRGDTVSRMQAYATAVQAGIRTVNECRSMDNLPAMEGGDVLLRPLNMEPIGGATEEEPKQEPKGQRMLTKAHFIFGSPESRASDEEIEGAALVEGVTKKQADTMKKAFSRWFERQVKEVDAIAERYLGERSSTSTNRLISAIEAYYEDLAYNVPDDVKGAIKDISEKAFKKVRSKVGNVEALTPEWYEGYMERYYNEVGNRIGTANMHELKRMLERDDASLEGIRKRYENWPTTRSWNMAKTECTFAMNEALVAGYRKAGYTAEWKAAPKCCSACYDFDGVTLYGDFRPPMHPGCGCTVDIGEKYI